MVEKKDVLESAALFAGIKPELILGLLRCIGAREVIRFSGLATQLPRRKSVDLSVLDKMRAALSEFKVDALPDTLLPDGEDPGVIQRPRARVGLTAYHHQLHAVQVSL